MEQETNCRSVPTKSEDGERSNNHPYLNAMPINTHHPPRHLDFFFFKDTPHPKSYQSPSRSNQKSETKDVNKRVKTNKLVATSPFIPRANRKSATVNLLRGVSRSILIFLIDIFNPLTFRQLLLSLSLPTSRSTHLR